MSTDTELRTPLVAAARALYQLAVSSNSSYSSSSSSNDHPKTSLAQQQRLAYGPGVFYANFETSALAAAFAKKPDTAGVWYYDMQRCRALRMPDTTLGALAAGRAPAIVVVDQFEPGVRCFSDSDGVIQEQCRQLWKVPVVASAAPDKQSDGENLQTAASPGPIGEALCDWVEQRVQASIQEEQQEQTKESAQGVVYYVEMADGPDCENENEPPLHIERVQPDEVQGAIDEMRAVLGESDVGDSVQTLQRLSQACPDNNAVVVWLRSVQARKADTAWIVYLHKKDEFTVGRNQ